MTNVPSSPYLEFETGVLNQKGVIFSGIVDLEWDLNDDHEHTQTQTINLGYKVIAVVQSTLTFGLASIYNGGSAFLMATNDARIGIDSETQELNMQVDLALMGTPSNLSRYSYQAVVIVTTQQTGISGTIRYPVGAFGPANPTVASLKGLFAITANLFVSTPGPGFGTGQNTPVAFGQLTGVSVQGTTVNVSYSIAAAPYNLDLTVLVASVPAAQLTGFSQVPTSHTLRLTTGAPLVSGIDFLYYQSSGIK